MKQINKASRFIFLFITLIFPFFLEKVDLDITKGGWHPERSTFIPYLLLLAFLLPFIAIALLPLSRSTKVILGILLIPTFLLCFLYFVISYACGVYGHSCF